MAKTKTNSKIIALILIFFLVFGLSVWPKNKAKALGSALRINEVAPSESSSQDWVEFYAAEEGDYSNFKVKERTTLMETFPSNFYLQTGDFVVLHISQTGQDEDNTTGKGTNNIWDLYSDDTGLTGTDNVIILENSLGEIKDAVCFANYDSTWASSQETAFNNAATASQWTGVTDDGGVANNEDCFDWRQGGAGKSLGRDGSSVDTDNSEVAKDDWYLYDQQTPGRSNIAESEEEPQTPSPTYSDQIILNELLPNPAGSDEEGEFIELKNQGNEAMDLKDWQIQDASTTYKIKSLDFPSVQILAKGFFVIYRNKSGIALNNTGGETVSLLSPDGKIKSSISYSATAPEGQSFSLISSGWSWTQTPTPGQENVLTLASPQNQNPKAVAGDSKKLYAGEKATFDGSDSYDPDSDPLSYFWNFGDGGSASGAVTTHTYKKTGKYKAALKVEDGRGGVSEDSISVTVSEREEETTKKETNRPKGPFSREIIVNEVMANPKGTDSGDGSPKSGEWIELKNIGKKTVDLYYWQIDDIADGGSRPYTFREKTEIKAGQFLVLYYPQIKITLNNTQEAVRLLDPDGKVASQTKFSGAKENLAFAFDGKLKKWFWTQKPTPGKENQIVEPKKEEKSSTTKSYSTTSTKEETQETKDSNLLKIISIAKAREQERNTKVKIKGQVIVEPGTLGSKIFYLQDETEGIQIYFSKEDFPQLALGDLVTVTGKASQAQDEKKVNLSQKEDVAFLSHGEAPKAMFLKTGDIDEKYEGRLVEVEGEIVKKVGTTSYLDDGSGQIRFYFKKETGIKKEGIKKGEKVRVKGVVSQTTSGYRILPRYENDVLVGEAEIAATGEKGGILSNKKLPSVGNDIWVIFLLALAITFSIMLPRAVFFSRKFSRQKV